MRKLYFTILYDIWKTPSLHVPRQIGWIFAVFTALIFLLLSHIFVATWEMAVP